MIHVTYGYTVESFETMDDAQKYIDATLNRHDLAYQKVLDMADGILRVMVYQYCTLYMEAFLIHENMDVRR